ncbi:hypothetical protein [Rhizobacter sp. OV335]|uniref:hypothetical protein n=1 Tax=Rhizobacter sp. OV335 TaxID=1500264 RepID=UPI000936B117|nr:hypothetical protein [Rhizobacter sp. OV335]
MTTRLWDRRATLRALGAAGTLIGAPAAMLGQSLSPELVYEALRQGRGESLNVPGGKLMLVLNAQGAGPEWVANVHQWVLRAVTAVSAYFGRFPVDRAGLLIRAVPGSGVRGGVSYGFDSSAVKVDVGIESQPSDLRDDWVLTHEFVHLGFPSLRRQHVWIEEGSATYVEPIARVQAGQLSATRMWQDVFADLPKGLPAPGDNGLDNTHTWARTYWGGALFCLLADVELRRETEGRHGLQTALRAIRDNSRGNVAFWTIEQTLAIGDGATGRPVLMNLYRKMAPTAMDVDLAGLMAQLGVHGAPGKAVELDDSAPLASVRRAITSVR